MATVNQNTQHDAETDVDSVNEQAVNDKLAQSVVFTTVTVGRGDAKRNVSVASRLGYEWDQSRVAGYRGQSRVEAKLPDCDVALQEELLQDANSIAASHRGFQRELLRAAMISGRKGDRLKSAAQLKLAMKLKAR